MLHEDNWCFACGADNPHGLKLTDFEFDGMYYSVNWQPSRCHQGWANIAHGGLVATVLDEVMTKLLWYQGINAATAELNVRYHAATPVDEQLTARSWVVANKRQLYKMAAELMLSDGTILASAEGKFMTPEEHTAEE